MDNEIKVSVYCLAYNHEKYIRNTLEGFVSQRTDFKYEVFVHDDASTDGTVDIIKSYAEKYPEIIKPILQKENQYSQGVTIIEKYILPHMNGKYIAACEGDDYWDDEYKLQKQYDVMEAHPECSLVTHKVKGCNEDGSPNTRQIPTVRYKLNSTGIIEPDEMAELMWERGGYPFHTSSYFYRKTIREKYSTSVHKWLKRDVGVLRACMLNGSVYYINEVMSTRRNGSIEGWNYRLRKSGIDGRIRLSINDSDAEMCFDAFSEYKYHDMISKCVFLRMLAVSKYAPVKIKRYLKEKGLSFGKVARLMSLKEKVRYGGQYFMLSYVPFVWKLLGNIRLKKYY